MGLGLLIGLAIIWLPAYFILGVTPTFILGLVRSVVAPPRTASDVTAPPGVRVSAWALLLPGDAEDGPDADPARAADPAYAAALDAELGAGAINASDAPGREQRT